MAILTDLSEPESDSCIRAAESRTEIATASIVCGTCQERCALISRRCEICEAAPRLQVGGYSFRGAKKTLYDASKGLALSNSVVFLGRAKGPAKELEGEDSDAQELQIAMKTVPLVSDSDSIEMARREIQVFQSLGSRHPNLLPLLFGAETETELVLLTPYAPSGDLFSLTSISGDSFRCLEEQDAGNLASQILTGLNALHTQRLMHGDVKPHNVFLTKTDGAFVAQLGDFGLTRRVPLGEDGIVCQGGTPGYKAPEMSRGSACALVSFAADLFASGVMLYELLSSMSPFSPPSNVHAALEFDEMCWEPLNPEAQVFVRQLLDKKPDNRGTASSALAHPWLALSQVADRGAKRELYAPIPDGSLQFHSVDRVWELSGNSLGARKHSVGAWSQASTLCAADTSDSNSVASIASSLAELE